MNNILTVVGARPQFIKAAPVSRALLEAGLSETIVHTGQHSDANMSDIFFDELAIPKPGHFLGISGLTHGAMTAQMLSRIEEILIEEKPDALLVYGDTNSTLAGALAASKLHIPIAHVESGLRSFNMRMPEEINRILTDKVSEWLFCPTAGAVQNLESEGCRKPQYKIQNVGDVMFDSALYFKNKAKWPSAVAASIQSRPFVLCTLHRQESIDEPNVFEELVDSLKTIAQSMPVIWPVHPRARKMISAIGLNTDGLTLIAPVGYLEMLALLEACSLVATDSGGLQKEAYFFEKRCLTLRTETEWTELVAAEVNVLCGHDRKLILSAFDSVQSTMLDFPFGLYGNGNASSEIADTLSRDLKA